MEYAICIFQTYIVMLFLILMFLQCTILCHQSNWWSILDWNLHMSYLISDEKISCGFKFTKIFFYSVLTVNGRCIFIQFTFFYLLVFKLGTSYLLLINEYSFARNVFYFKYFLNVLKSHASCRDQVCIIGIKSNCECNTSSFVFCLRQYKFS